MTRKPFSERTRRFCLIAAVSAVCLAAVAVHRPAVAGASVDCEGTLSAWRYDASLRGYMSTHDCSCQNGENAQPVCTPRGGGSSGGSYGGGLSSGDQMKLSILQSAMDSFANSFIKWVNSPPSSPQGPTPEEIAAERAKEEKIEAEWRAKVQKQINEMQDEYQKAQQQKVEASKARLLAGMKGMAGSGGRQTAMRQLCRAYWSTKAAEAMLNNEEKAREYSDFANNLDPAAMDECVSAIPEPPMPSSGDQFRSDLYEAVIEAVHLRLPMIKQAKEKQKEADEQVAEKEQKLEELKAKQTAAASVEEKQAVDPLVAEAMKELEDATSQKNEADAGVRKLKLQIDALREVGKMAGDQNKKTSEQDETP